VWPHINKPAAERWEIARPAVVALAEQHDLPPENLMTVSTLADIIWPDDLDVSETALRQAMTMANVRPWQQDLVAPMLVSVLGAHQLSAHHGAEASASATKPATPSGDKPTPASTPSLVPAGM